MKPANVKEYLGDSVYGELVGDSIKLTTENGFGASNEIWLDYSVLYALCVFITAHTSARITIEPKEEPVQT